MTASGRRALIVGGGILFILLATANGGGYRYGVSDQAFYQPVVARALDPSLFPRDHAVIDAQGRLMLYDELLAGLARTTGAPLDALFLGGYLVSLALVYAGLVLIARSTAGSRWFAVALVAAFTLRHRIPRTSANSLEPYFHPRILAFGLGTLAIAALLRRRSWVAIALVGLAAVLHITTAMWFAVMLGVALAVLDVRLRWLATAGAAAAAAFLAWALSTGPLRSSLTSMDAAWLQAVAGKDSLLATGWPAWAWAANLGLLVALWVAHRWRASRGMSSPADRALVWGATALVALFLVTLPFVVARTAFPVQLQIPRVFWLVDLVATVYVLAAIRSDRVAAVVATLLVAGSVARGAYVLTIEFPDRPLFAMALPDTPWQRAMTWLGRQPVDTHVLADPGHAWRYGTSVRVSAGRDVFLEDVKDSALAIYSRDVAARYVERTRAIGDFGGLTDERARALARQYDLDYLVTEQDMQLPVAYRNDQFRIYSLIPDP